MAILSLFQPGEEVLLKRAFAAVLAAVVLLVGAAPALAATPLSRKVTTLQRQVTTLQRQVRTLQRQATTLRRQTQEAEDLGVLSGVIAFCTAAITADALQNTWEVVNQLSPRTAFPARQTVNDRGICERIRIARQPTQVPPTVAPFSALLQLLSGRAATPYAVPWWMWGQ
jgi:hypothetical protein